MFLVLIQSSRGLRKIEYLLVDSEKIVFDSVSLEKKTLSLTLTNRKYFFNVMCTIAYYC